MCRADCRSAAEQPEPPEQPGCSARCHASKRKKSAVSAASAVCQSGSPLILRSSPSPQQARQGSDTVSGCVERLAGFTVPSTQVWAGRPRTGRVAWGPPYRATALRGRGCAHWSCDFVRAPLTSASCTAGLKNIRRIVLQKPRALGGMTAPATAKERGFHPEAVVHWAVTCSAAC